VGGGISGSLAHGPTAWLVNTSRGPIVVEADFIAALKDGKIAGAAIDVFAQEPLSPDRPFRSLPNPLATPHIGYVSRTVRALLPGHGQQHPAMARGSGFAVTSYPLAAI
jgi:hypothetical protein